MPLSRDLAEESQGSDRKWKGGKKQSINTHTLCKQGGGIYKNNSNPYLTPFSFSTPTPASQAVCQSLRKLHSPCIYKLTFQTGYFHVL